MALISVIVPAYNAQSTIAKCVESILCPLSAEERTLYEVILVDDGSKDGTYAACASLAEKYSQVRLFAKPNGGVSSARNLGIEKASGQWIAFIDSDDCLTDNAAKTLLQLCQDGCADIFIYSIAYDYGADCIRVADIAEFCGDKHSYLLQLPRMEGRELQICSVCNKVYRAEVLRENHIRFLNMSYGEDLSFNMDCLTYASSIKSVNASLYIYDCSVADSGVKRFRENFDDMITAMTDKADGMLSSLCLQGTETQAFLWGFLATCWLYVSEICLASKFSVSQKASQLSAWYGRANKDILQMAADQGGEMGSLIWGYMADSNLQKNIRWLLRKRKVNQIKSKLYRLLK